MRKLYASPRIENLERLVAVMTEHGIATEISNRRAYDSKSYSRFSYARAGHRDNWPAVWVTHAADHTRARELMHEIGIEPATRYAEELASYRTRGTRRRGPAYVAARIRTAVLMAVVIAVALYVGKLMSVW